VLNAGIKFCLVFINKKNTLKENIMKKTIVMKNLLLATATALMFTACADNKQKESKEVAEETNEKKFETNDAEKDAQFIVNATSGSYDEVAVADVALTKSANAEVKKLAQQLKTDHSAVITQLNGVAATKNVTVPTAATEDGTEAAKKLAETEAKNFDKNWLEKVEDMHESSIKKYEDASNNATDATIKNWAATTLVKIRGHLDMINKMQETIK
jgi:putative membrane protein